MIVRSSKDIGALIQAERAAQGLSQRELATRAGVSQAWISWVENGKPTAEIGSVLNVLALLGVSVEMKGAPPEPGGQAPDPAEAEENVPYRL